jgi:hypothetical protein
MEGAIGERGGGRSGAKNCGLSKEEKRQSP